MLYFDCGVVVRYGTPLACGQDWYVPVTQSYLHALAFSSAVSASPALWRIAMACPHLRNPY